jgi:RNA polymerase sigma-70 factor (ECF subfamily)
MLMHAAQTGNGDAYCQLMQELEGRIRRVVRHHRGFLASEDVEDLVQDVLLSVHAVRATYDSRRPFMPWLLAIVRNRLADGARRFARRSAHEVSIEELDVTFSDRDTNPTSEPFGDAESLKRAIRTLPRGQRDAIEMLKLRGLSLKEASAATGTSIGALKVATHRAMQALRRTLSKTS